MCVNACMYQMQFPVKKVTPHLTAFHIISHSHSFHSRLVMAQFSFFITIFCAFLLIQTTLSQSFYSPNNYTCKITTYFFWPFKFCILSGLNVTTSRKHLRLEPKYAIEELNGVNFEDSEVQVLTSDVCDTLPFLTHILATEIGLTMIEEKAFQKCSKLEFLRLTGNSLTDLPARLFTWNEHLSVLDLSENQLIKVDANLFKDNGNLKVIALSDNRLHSIPKNLFSNNLKIQELYLAKNGLRELAFLDEMPVMRHLTNFDLDYNKLLDVDVDFEKLHEKFPNVRTIGLEGINFLCTRQDEFKKLLEQKGVTEVRLDNCILDSAKTNNIIHDTQEMAKNETAKILWAFESRLKNLTSENTSVKDELQVIYLIVIILGTTLIALIIGMSIACLVKKIRTKYGKSGEEDYEYYERNNIRMDSFNVPVTRNDPYYTYVPGFRK